MASEKVVHLTEQDFDQKISKGYTLVDFWAEWCGPCRAIAPTIDQLADEYSDKVQVAKVDIDSNPQIPHGDSVQGWAAGGNLRGREPRENPRNGGTGRLGRTAFRRVWTGGVPGLAASSARRPALVVPDPSGIQPALERRLSRADSSISHDQFRTGSADAGV
jgi:thiol-disulfide isomerase/thioredoxin